MIMTENIKFEKGERYGNFREEKSRFKKWGWGRISRELYTHLLFIFRVSPGRARKSRSRSISPFVQAMETWDKFKKETLTILQTG